MAVPGQPRRLREPRGWSKREGRGTGAVGPGGQGRGGGTGFPGLTPPWTEPGPSARCSLFHSTRKTIPVSGILSPVENGCRGKPQRGRPRPWSDTVRRDSKPGCLQPLRHALLPLLMLRVSGKRHRRLQPGTLLALPTAAPRFCAERGPVRSHVNARGRRIGLERRRHVTLGHPWAMGGEQHGQKGRGASVFGSRAFDSRSPPLRA